MTVPQSVRETHLNCRHSGLITAELRALRVRAGAILRHTQRHTRNHRQVCIAALSAPFMPQLRLVYPPAPRFSRGIYMRRVALFFRTPFPFDFCAFFAALAASRMVFHEGGTSSLSRSSAAACTVFLVLCNGMRRCSACVCEPYYAAEGRSCGMHCIQCAGFRQTDVDHLDCIAIDLNEHSGGKLTD